MEGWDPEELEIWEGFYVRVFNTTEEMTSVAGEQSDLDGGLYWRDTTQRSLVAKVQEAANRFHEKYHIIPTHVQVHPDIDLSDGLEVMAVEIDRKLGKETIVVKLLGATYVQPHHFFVYREEE
jgi:hypothetical protein